MNSSAKEQRASAKQKRAHVKQLRAEQQAQLQAHAEQLRAKQVRRREQELAAQLAEITKLEALGTNSKAERRAYEISLYQLASEQKNPAIYREQLRIKLAREEQQRIEREREEQEREEQEWKLLRTEHAELLKRVKRLEQQAGVKRTRKSEAEPPTLAEFSALAERVKQLEQQASEREANAERERKLRRARIAEQKAVEQDARRERIAELEVLLYSTPGAERERLAAAENKTLKQLSEELYSLEAEEAQTAAEESAA